MSYDLSITRSDGDSEAEVPITEAEWNTLVANDPELEPTPEVAVTNPRTGERITMRGNGMTTWRSSTGRTVGLLFSHGRISFRATDDQVVMAKMRQIAAALDARIQGEDGEWYDPD